MFSKLVTPIAPLRRLAERFSLWGVWVFALIALYVRFQAALPNI